MEPDLYAIGINDDPALVRERLEKTRVPVVTDTTGAVRGIYTDPSGAKVAFGTVKGTEYFDAGLESPYAYRALGYRVSHSLAHLDVYRQGGEFAGRFLAYVDNPSVLELNTPAELTVRPAALGAEVAVYESEAAYEQDQVEHDGLKLDARHLKSPWLLALHGGEASGQEATSVAMFAAVVESAQLRTNELTGEKFWYVLGESMVPMAIALPAEAAAEIKPGSVIAGAFIIVAGV